MKSKTAVKPTWWNYLTMILFAATSFFLIVLVARPQISQEKNDDKLGIDFIMTIDQSGSMAVDFEGDKSRMEAVTEIIATFIKGIKHDRVGLVAFSGNAFTLCPLTHDYSVFEYYLKMFENKEGWRVGGSGGTAVGDAILYSVDKFQENVDRTKVIILITDGASNSGIDTLKAAAYAKQQKVKIYTLLVSGKYDEKEAIQSMQAIANATDGLFYDVKNTQQLNEVFEEIETLEKKKLTIAAPRIYFDNPTPYVIFIALLWLSYIGAKIVKKEYV